MIVAPRPFRCAGRADRLSRRRGVVVAVVRRCGCRRRMWRARFLYCNELAMPNKRSASIRTSTPRRRRCRCRRARRSREVDSLCKSILVKHIRTHTNRALSLHTHLAMPCAKRANSSVASSISSRPSRRANSRANAPISLSSSSSALSSSLASARFSIADALTDSVDEPLGLLGVLC
jgi:hypothetical protein